MPDTAKKYELELSKDGRFWQTLAANENLDVLRELAKDLLATNVTNGYTCGRIRPQVTDVFTYTADIGVEEEALH